MSQGEGIPYAIARQYAELLVEQLQASCERIEIAGSVRRRKPEVHDLEIVAIPRFEEREIPGLLEPDRVRVNLLEERLGVLRMAHAVRLRDVVVTRQNGTVETQQRDGAAYKALQYSGVPVDLFITDAERWGCIFALRTGPGDWNTRLVTECKRWFRRVEEGRVLHLGKVIPTPEEADFFAALGVPWVDPWDRHVSRLRFDSELLRRGAA